MIRQNLENILGSIKEVAHRCKRDPADIRLVAVSKRFPISAIEEALAAGQLIFGENYIQEAVEKKQYLQGRVKLHFIGNLQSNKARMAAENCDMIETIDRPKIVKTLHQHLEKMDRYMDVLVQVNVGEDPNKSGVLPPDTESLLVYMENFTRLRLRGLMTMPPFTPDPEMARPYFQQLRLLSEEMRSRGLLGQSDKIELSMGMSHDYHVAVEEGATLIRIGTAIFGQRPPAAITR